MILLPSQTSFGKSTLSIRLKSVANSPFCGG
jgi:hypothetical protein